MIKKKYKRVDLKIPLSLYEQIVELAGKNSSKRNKSGNVVVTPTILSLIKKGLSGGSDDILLQEQDKQLEELINQIVSDKIAILEARLSDKINKITSDNIDIKDRSLSTKSSSKGIYKVKESDEKSDKEPDKESDNQSDSLLGNLLDNQFEDKSDGQPDKKSDDKINNPSDNKSDNQPDNKSDSQPENKSGNQSNGQSDEKSDKKSDKKTESSILDFNGVTSPVLALVLGFKSRSSINSRVRRVRNKSWSMADFEEWTASLDPAGRPWYFLDHYSKTFFLQVGTKPVL